MAQLFHTDFCLSGQCVCREHMEAMIASRSVSDDKDRLALEHKAKDLLCAGMRLMIEQDIHAAHNASQFSSGPSGAV
jgi:hypothetical protein